MGNCYKKSSIFYCRRIMQNNIKFQNLNQINKITIWIKKVVKSYVCTYVSINDLFMFHKKKSEKWRTGYASNFGFNVLVVYYLS